MAEDLRLATEFIGRMYNLRFVFPELNFKVDWYVVPGFINFRVIIITARLR